MAKGALEHARHDLIGRTVTIREGLDVDDHLFAHLDSALDRRRTHMGQQDHVRQLQQPWVDVGAMFVDVKPRPGQFSRAQRAVRALWSTTSPRDVFTTTAVGFISFSRRAFKR